MGFGRFSPSLCLILLTGCASIKKAGLVGTATIASGAIASIASSSVVPVLMASGITASVTSVTADILMRNENMECEAKTIFDAVESLIGIAGWGVLAFFVLPMALTWLTPSPLEKKKK